MNAAQAERLVCLMEEMAESTQEITKAIRHGLDSIHPERGVSNRQSLEKELGHVLFWLTQLTQHGDINPQRVCASMLTKEVTAGKWLHHTPIVVGKSVEQVGSLYLESRRLHDG